MSFPALIWKLLLLFSTTENAYSSLNDISDLLSFLITEPYYPKNTSTFMDEYDYIVVGAGTAGSVVANRLSEVPCVNVLLLEAGGEPPILTEVPSFSPIAWFTETDWQFKTVPQQHSCINLKNRQTPIIAGKMLGGGSSLNEMLYVRGNKKDYDDWAAMGAEGWSYEEVLPYFKKLESNQNPLYATTVYHNDSGPVSVENPKYRPIVKRRLERSIREMGHDIVNSNGERQTGFYDMQGNTKMGRRCSTSKAYLVTTEKRPNIHIVTYAVVKKVLIENKRATGVEFDYKSKTYQVKATREVILSAGAFKTPQLLMLSGIGPKEELEKFKIPVVIDLPVGRSFHDHVMTTIPYELGPQVVPIYLKILNPMNLIRFLTDGSGPYSSLEFAAFLAFLSASQTQTDDDPDFQLNFHEFITIDMVAVGYNLKPDVYDAYFKPYDFRPLMICLVTNMKTKSRGSITLNSTDIYDPPIIDPNYLADPRDYDSLVEGIKMCQKTVKTKSMQQIGAKPFATVMPGCEPYVGDENNYFRCYIQHFTNSAFHYAGSVKMGDPGDPSTVLDPKLRVKNIDGLRVADASVMPKVVSGNTNIPTMMIGEKAADMIKETIGKCESRNANKKRKVISPPEEILDLKNPSIDTAVQSSMHFIKSSLEALQHADAMKKSGIPAVNLKSPTDVRTSILKTLQEKFSSMLQDAESDIKGLFKRL